MRVRVDIEPRDPSTWAVTVTCERDEDSVRTGPTEIPRLSSRPWLRPPGAAEDDRDPVEILDRVDSEGETPLQPDDTVALGRYLFDSVLAFAWEAVLGAVSHEDVELIEIALALSDEEPGLQALHWELLHDGKYFLTTHPEMAVAITRLVSSPAPEPPRISAPARMLFAIGAELSDPEIRAGAEFLGLMRDLENEDQTLIPLIVDEASVERLHHHVNKFQPDAVHVIAHGAADDPEQSPHLLMRPEDGGRDPEAVDAEALAVALTSATGLPQIVVVSACDSATVRASVNTPLAADLVRHGVPIAIGMAGRVSDLACRLFTRRFGSVLVAGGSLVRAAADARRAAYRGKPPWESLDWALPAVFLADSVPNDFQPVDVTGAVQLRDRINRYQFERGPVFCGRRGFFACYEQLMAPSGALSALMIYTEGKDSRVGKTRLLEEFAAQALRDGHVPVMLPVERGEGGRQPRGLRDLAEDLVWAIIQTRRHFRLEVPPAFELLTAIRPDGETPPDLAEIPPDRRGLRYAEIFDEFGQRASGALGARRFAEAAALDLDELLANARDAGDPIVNDDSRVLLLLDGVHEWPDALQGLFAVLDERMGLGISTPIPLVMTCRKGDVSAELIEQYHQEAKARNWPQWQRLAPFTDPEDGLAYQWVLLTPRPPLSTTVYASKRGDREWVKHYRFHMEGLPEKFRDPRFFELAELLCEDGKLEPGDDQDRFEKYELEQQRLRGGSAL